MTSLSHLLCVLSCLYHDSALGEASLICASQRVWMPVCVCVRPRAFSACVCAQPSLKAFKWDRKGSGILG